MFDLKLRAQRMQPGAVSPLEQRMQMAWFHPLQSWVKKAKLD